MNKRQRVKLRTEFFSRESGGTKKKWKDKLPIGLIFPNHYRVGMSNLGFQTIYHLLNEDDDIVCERIFLPEESEKVLSVESGRPLADFPILALSSSFEEDFPRFVQMLQISGIEPLAEKRLDGPIASGTNPLIIAGGVATFINPEPLAPFVDLFVIGEVEEILAGIVNDLHVDIGQKNKEELLYTLATTSNGCYAPRFYTPVYDAGGKLLEFRRADGVPEKIKKNLITGLGKSAHSRLISPDAEFSDLYLTELGRGCSRSCRFCAAGFVYRPPRLWTSEAIIDSLCRRPSAMSRVGLLGMEMAGSDKLKKVAEYLLDSSCSLSFSSLRADAMSETLIELLGQSNLKSAAIAPDGASERLRRVINKGIVEKDILSAAEMLVDAGVANLKLYFMIGLPTETDEDIEEMIDLVLKVKQKILALGRARGWLSNITLSVNSFVPKAWTPFQFHPFVDPGTLKKRVKHLRKKLAGEANVKIMSDQPANALFQAILARGDRRVGTALTHFYTSRGNWRQVFKSAGVSRDYVVQYHDRNEIFPWDIIDHGIKRDYLWAEYQRALAGKSSPVCDTLNCRRCGVCDGS